jgi:hypothetical protein
MKRTAVYLMFDYATGAVKIGYSVKPRTRATTLLSDRHSIKLMFYAYQKSVNDAQCLESSLHTKFRPFRLNGEWFLLSKDAVDSIIEELQNGESELDEKVYSQFSSLLEMGVPSCSATQLHKKPAYLSFKEECDGKMREIEELKAEKQALRDKWFNKVIQEQDYYSKLSKKTFEIIQQNREAKWKYTVATTKTNLENSVLLERCERLANENRVLKNYIKLYTWAASVPKWFDDLILKVSRARVQAFATRQT